MLVAVKLTKNGYLDKYRYSSQFSLSDVSWSKNVVIFGVDNSSGVANAVKTYQFKAKDLEIKP